MNRVRGTAADPEHVVVSTGFAQGLSLVAQRDARDGRIRMVLSRTRRTPSTGPPSARPGSSLSGSRSTRTGLRVDLLDAADVDAVVVTAAHQYPTGGVLPPDRRSALVDWAERRGA